MDVRRRESLLPSTYFIIPFFFGRGGGKIAGEGRLGINAGWGRGGEASGVRACAGVHLHARGRILFAG